MQKKTKRKLNKKRFFGLLIFLAIGISFICYLLNLKVSNVLIIGNQEILDSTIIKASGLREYPYYKDIKKRMLEKEIGDIPLIDTVKVSKYLNGTIKIKVTEETPIVYLENTYKIITSSNKVYENIKVSEIEYSPTVSSEGKTIDDKRFTFYMNDGNIAIINTINIDKFNNYLKVVSKAIDTYGKDTSGTYNFDSGTSNVVFQKKDSEKNATEN